jgi:hypothetical protein
MAMASPTVALFGYHSSAFTQKLRMILKLRQIPYCEIFIPSGKREYDRSL